MLATADKVNLTLGSDEVYVGLGAYFAYYSMSSEVNDNHLSGKLPPGMAKHVEHMVKMVQTVKNGCNSPSKGHDSPRYRHHLF